MDESEPSPITQPLKQSRQIITGFNINFGVGDKILFSIRIMCLSFL